MNNDEVLDCEEATNCILTACNKYMLNHADVIGQQQILWGLVENLSVVLAVSQPPEWIMSQILHLIKTSPKRDLEGQYHVADPKKMQ